MTPEIAKAVGAVLRAWSRAPLAVYAAMTRLRGRRQRGVTGDRCRIVGLAAEGALADVWDDAKHTETA